MAEGWDQSRFDATLREYLMEHESKVWPQAINKKGFFVALAALKETPRAEPEKIFGELGREITGKREDGTSGPIPISFGIASKRASKAWVRSKQYGRALKRVERGRAAKGLQEWRALFANKLRTMLGGRKASATFLASGWTHVLQKLGPLIGGRYDRSGARVRGSTKGSADPALPGRLQVVIQNSAAARSEHRGGFHRVGDPALQLAFDRETASMVEHMENEMRPGAEKFNRQQH